MKTFLLDSRIEVETLPVKGPYRGTLSVSEVDLQGLADRFGFVEIPTLDVRLEIARVGPDAWDVKGRLQAAIIQPCIVTGEPVSETVDFVIEERYVRSAHEDDEIIVGLEDSEPLVDGCIELGEMVAQSLALAANAWPRTADAPDEFKAGKFEDAHPFASLGSLKLPEK